jgi:hypothetical protein
MKNTEATPNPRYIVKAGGPTYTTAYARFWIVIDTAKQDAVVMRTADRSQAEKFAGQMEAIMAL